MIVMGIFCAYEIRFDDCVAIMSGMRKPNEIGCRKRKPTSTRIYPLECWQSEVQKGGIPISLNVEL